MSKAKRKHKKVSKAEALLQNKRNAEMAKESFMMFCGAVKMMPFRKRFKFCWSIMFRRVVR